MTILKPSDKSTACKGKVTKDSERLVRGQGENGPGTPRTPPREVHRSPQTFQQLNRNKKVSPETFGLFSDRVIELCNLSLSSMYHHVFKKYWNDDRFFARMRRNYVESDIDDGYYEIYIPTRDVLDGTNLKYYNIKIKTVPGLDKDIEEKEAKKLIMETRVAMGQGAAGKVDSELLVLIAPHLSKKGLALWREDKEREREGLKAKKEWFLKGHMTYPSFKYPNARGYYTMPIITRSPEEAIRRLLLRITKFLRLRLKKLIGKLHFGRKQQYAKAEGSTPRLERSRIEPWMIDHAKEGSFYYMKICNLIEQFSLSIANVVRCLSHSLYWLLAKKRHIEAKIKKQNKILEATEKANELSALLNEIPYSPRYLDNEPLPPVLMQLMKVLCVSGGHKNYG